MDDSPETAFRETLTQMADERLLAALVRMVNEPDQYRAEAIAAAKNEVSRRGISAERVVNAQRRAHQDVLESSLSEAVESALKGLSPAEIQADLLENGVDPTEAPELAERAGDLARAGRRPTGFRNLLNGTGLCVVGCVLTWAIYDLSGSILRVAAQPLAWGTVVVGVALCIRGVRQVRS